MLINFSIEAILSYSFISSYILHRSELRKNFKKLTFRNVVFHRSVFTVFIETPTQHSVYNIFLVKQSVSDVK